MGKDLEKVDRVDRKRMVVMAISTFVLFFLLISQFFNIQILQEEKWSKRAEGQHYFTVHEPFRRGRFFSNVSVKEGHPEKEQQLVTDIQKFHLYCDPYSIPESNQDEVVQALIRLVGVEEEDREKLREQFGFRKSRSRKLATWLNREERDRVREWWLPYAKKQRLARNALFFVSEYQRSHPFGKLLGQVLHTVRDARNEETKQGIPTGGLEAAFNKELKGQLGERRMMRSPRNSLATGEVIKSPEDGADIYLTVNHNLQAIAEEELARGVRKAKAKRGWAVMMDPSNGEILALAQFPFFYPANYRDYFNDPEKVSQTKVAAISDAYEPGSVMKPITVAIALMANEEQRKKGKPPIFSPEEKIPTTSGKFPGRQRPIEDVGRHRFLNMYMALQKSSNIYVARLAERFVDRLGAPWYREMLSEKFGFGEKTSLELPGETYGVLPRPGKLHANGTLEWSKPTPFSLAMGYNLQVNTLQVMRAWAVLANGGRLVTPTLLRKIVKRDDEGHEELLLDQSSSTRADQFPVVIDRTLVKDVVKGLKYVTSRYGSGRRADIPGYTQVGKSGTTKHLVNGQYTSEKHLASFIGFTPVDDPRFLLYVLIDEPEVTPQGSYYGGVCAAPVFGAIAKRSLAYLGVTPDDPHGYPPGDPRYKPEEADWQVEAKALREKYRSWNDAP